MGKGTREYGFGQEGKKRSENPEEYGWAGVPEKGALSQKVNSLSLNTQNVGYTWNCPDIFCCNFCHDMCTFCLDCCSSFWHSVGEGCHSVWHGCQDCLSCNCDCNCNCECPNCHC